MDANEHIYKKKLGTAQTSVCGGLNMREVVGEFTKRQLEATFFSSTNPTDGVWATSDLEVIGTCVISVGYRVEYHWMSVVNFATASITG